MPFTRSLFVFASILGMTNLAPAETTHPAMGADEAASEAKSKIIDGVSSSDLRLSDAQMSWWRDAKFGLFMHWGLYAIPAKGEWWQHSAKIPNEEYAKLADQFNPKHFDANAWANAAKEAGMKYVVLTARHHDGFALWDSSASYGDFTSVKTA
ncbi:MAG: alpha-L-fucosidase, partial [Puniceicoccales bacterium]|nr:alpha-L-fucosidase [Puniceicoccales bacterium]